ncbi:MAG: periplasmic heavy metal sensor [Pseudomonadota bacterium]
MSEASKSRLPLWLIVSLLVNALLIGLLIGGGLGQRKGGPSPGGAGATDERALIRSIDQALPNQERQAVRQAFRRAFADTRQDRERVRDARRSLGRLLGADPYDADAVEAGFRELREADAAMRARMHQALAEQLGALSVEQRRAILRDASKNDGRRFRGDGERRPPPTRPFRDRD